MVYWSKMELLCCPLITFVCLSYNSYFKIIYVKFLGLLCLGTYIYMSLYVPINKVSLNTVSPIFVCLYPDTTELIVLQDIPLFVSVVFYFTWLIFLPFIYCKNRYELQKHAGFTFKFWQACFLMYYGLQITSRQETPNEPLSWFQDFLNLLCLLIFEVII